jgi:hypothetical protein
MVSLKLILISFSWTLVYFGVFDHAGSVMHYGLGSAMKTKLNTNGAVIGQRKGLSKVGRNTKVISNCQLGDILREELSRSRLTLKTKCLTYFSCWTVGYWQTQKDVLPIVRKLLSCETPCVYPVPPFLQRYSPLFVYWHLVWAIS